MQRLSGGGQDLEPCHIDAMHSSPPVGIVAALWVACCASTPAQLKVLAIGDSLTEEYAFEVPFSAPDSDPLDSNTENWVEILAQRRPAEFSMGSYSGTIGSYPDLRNAGFKYNYGVPSLTAEKWVRVIQSGLFKTPSFIPPNSRWSATLRTMWTLCSSFWGAMI